MSPHFNFVGLKIYVNVLKKVVVPWMKVAGRNCPAAKFTFRLDSAPAHKTNSIQHGC